MCGPTRGHGPVRVRVRRWRDRNLLAAVGHLAGGKTIGHVRRTPQLVLAVVGVLLTALVVIVLIAAQRPSAPPDEVQAVMDCTPWLPDAPPNPTIAAPTDVRATHVADEQRIGVTWRDETDGETCFGVLQTANVPPELSPEGRPTLISVTLANANGISTAARPGLACFRVYAGSGDGRSGLSEEACVAVPAPQAPAGPSGSLFGRTRSPERAAAGIAPLPMRPYVSARRLSRTW